MNQITKKLRNTSVALFGAFCGGLLIVPAVPQLVVAQQQPQQKPNAKVNPCPKIFYEQPHDTRVFVPEGCPANTFTRQNGQGVSSSNYPATPSQSQIQMGVGGETTEQTTPSAPTMQQRQDMNMNSSSSETRVYQSSRQTNTNYIQPPLQGQQQTNRSYNLPQQTAVATVSPTSGKVSVKLVNETNAPVTYQIIGDSTQRTLGGKSEVMLQGLAIPKTVTFYRQDRGLLMVTPQGSSSQGSLQLTLRETTDFNMDRTTMRIEPNGSVYLN
ncbi:hypothetical protein [Iningainema tapete]|uniref:Uncharacterized protein n=1 Tax=Iningainema tapete BLCC-T55 TaxID=2748662 RepID=A0A8J6XN31_9CYAN|nr:hypothetical protein [Iningainema tapete]MBD2774889.1 hypothetical protein [Iningainema tapete BLCC-T55]